MDLKKLNDVSLLEVKPNIKLSAFPLNVPLPIYSAKLVKTKFCETVLLEFEDRTTFLPKRVVPLIRDNLENFTSGKYCLVFRGLKDVNKSSLGTKFEFIENEDWPQSACNSEIENAWEIGCAALIPEKSKDRCEKVYKMFKKWCEEKDGASINEKMLLAYFVHRNKALKSPGSLWVEYSMLKSTTFLKDAIDISKFSTLIAYLKRKNIGHRPKKASVFTKEDIKQFLNEASDVEFLILKVGLILGVAGACRRDELYSMTIDDIEDHQEYVIVKIPNTKTNIQRSFTVTNKIDDEIHYVEFLRKYSKLRPTHTNSKHLFLNYRRGKCSTRVVGRRTIGSWPSKIAKYLKLEHPESYTGHSFRRTSATLLANKGVDILGLKRHGGWRSSAAESYVEDSLQNKIEFAEKILHDGVSFSSTAVSLNTLKTNTASTSSITINNCTNCTFNFNVS